MLKKNANLLIVGAGGVGCELLKILALSGIPKLSVLDLDLIDKSNLNRQFLFRRCHVGQSKAEVACQTIKKLCPKIDVKPYHNNILNSQFDRSFFKQFDLVLNALDNYEARRHVNRMCMASDVPLIDSGSAGFKGQVTPFVYSGTRCFECHELPRQKGFPICTIRSMPSKPEHCVAWAKLLFEFLFGANAEESPLADLKAHLETSDHQENARSKELAQKVIRVCFKDEIQQQIDLQDATKKAGTRPRPLLLDELPALDPSKSDGGRRGCWNLTECVERLERSVTALEKRRTCDYSRPPLPLTFDKDDEDAMDFVAASTMLRMWNYRIGSISRWKAESIAGAIIPAIASTNAIVAGLQVVQALKLLDWKDKQAVPPDPPDILRSLERDCIRHVWVQEKTSGLHLLVPESLDGPNSACLICQTARAVLRVHSLKAWTLNAFVNAVIKEELGCPHPLVDLGEERRCIYDSEAVEDEENGSDRDKAFGLRRSLADWGVKSGTTLVITDLAQEKFQCELYVQEDSDLLNGKTADNDLSYLIEKSKVESSGRGVKRPRDFENEDPSQLLSKRRRGNAETLSDNVIDLENNDDNNFDINIDD